MGRQKPLGCDAQSSTYSQPQGPGSRKSGTDMMPSSSGSLGVSKDVRTTGSQQDAEESGVLSPDSLSMTEHEI